MSGFSVSPSTSEKTFPLNHPITTSSDRVEVSFMKASTLSWALSRSGRQVSAEVAPALAPKPAPRNSAAGAAPRIKPRRCIPSSNNGVIERPFHNYRASRRQMHISLEWSDLIQKARIVAIDPPSQLGGNQDRRGRFFRRHPPTQHAGNVTHVHIRPPTSKRRVV
jgi:hypothetical protein